MGTISRSTKTGGGTTLVSGRTADAADVETDMATVFTEINGQLNDDNIVSGAGIDPEKLDDHSASDAEQRSTDDPGVSDSENPATSLLEEIQQLRYKIGEQNALLSAVRVNGSGTTTASWYDAPVRGINLMPSATLNVESSTVSPAGWAKVGSPTSLAVQGGVVNSGEQSWLRTTCSATSQGISFNLDEPEAGARYLVAAKMLNSAGESELVTSGADVTSSFRDVTLTFDDTSDPQVKYGVFQVDASGTDVLITLQNSATASKTFDIFWAGLWRIDADKQPVNSRGSVFIEDFTNTAGLYTNAGFTLVPNLDQTIQMGADAKALSIRVDGMVSCTNAAASDNYGEISITQSIDGGGETTFSICAFTCVPSGVTSATTNFTNQAPLPGRSYRYRVYAASKTANAFDSGGSPAMSSTLTITVL